MELRTPARSSVPAGDVATTPKPESADPGPDAPAVAFPSRTLWFGVPEGVEVSVDARAIDTNPIDSPPAASALLKRDVGEPLARLIAVTNLRRQRVAVVEVQPLRYVSASGRFEIATRVEVDVHFSGGPRPGRPAAIEPAFESVYRDLLVNYEQARTYRRPASEDPPVVRRPVGFDVAASWVRVSVGTKGVQEVRGSDLESAGVPTAGIEPASLRLFTRPGVPLLDEGSTCDSCGLAEVAIRVEDGGDGRLDADDRILFFGLPASGWRDDYTGPRGAPAEWLDHPYDTHNIYWLTWNADRPDPPARWPGRSVAPVQSLALPASEYPARLHFEENHTHSGKFYEPGILWDQDYWQVLGSYQGSVNFDADVSGAIPNRAARLRARLWGVTGTPSPYTVDASFNGVALPGIPGTATARADLDVDVAAPVDGPNRLTLRVRPGSGSSAQIGFLYWELAFARRFQAVDDTLEFASPDSIGTYAFDLAPFTDAAIGTFDLLDVTNPLVPVELTDWVPADTTGGRAVRFHDAGGHRFYYAGSAGRRARPAVALADVRDVRTGAADYVVICSDALEAQAQQLAAHRRSRPPVPGATTAVVRMSDILAWYAGGRMDPVAIRNFLHDAVSNGRWNPAPSYVCFLGDATFDYRGLYGGDPALATGQVPTFPRNFFTGPYSSDDWLADVDFVDSSPAAFHVPDLIVGRLPAASPGEADALVAKVVDYDDSGEPGPWRNRALFLVDDLGQGYQPDPLGASFIENADSLERASTPLWLDREKIELVEYPFTQGSTKSGAHDELIRSLNDGAVFWDYVGRGNAFKLADENAFVLTDVAGLANGPRLPFAFLNTSDTGPFDNPLGTYLAEALVKLPAHGAVATFASTTISYAFSDFNLALALFPAVLTAPESGGTRSIGEATFVTKNRAGVTHGELAYELLGDPGLKLATPRRDVRFELFDDETGAALGDSLPLGRRVRIEGSVFEDRAPDAPGPLPAYTGTATVVVTDSAPVKDLDTPYGPSSYVSNPRTAFHGRFAVSGGRMTARFVVPMRSVPGPRARASVYVGNGTDDGSGALALRVVDGTPGPADTTGPVITVRFASGGSVVGPSEPVTVTMEDESGLYTMPGSMLGAMVLQIDDGPAIDVRSDFEYEPGSFTRGSVSRSLPGLADGDHRLTVFASDNLASGTSLEHRTEVVIPFRVASVVDAAEPRALALPNPFVARNGTSLVFTGYPDGANAEVRIYAVGGRRVRKLQGRSDSGHVQVDWDGRDDSGVRVAGGVYFYRAKVQPATGTSRDFDGRLVLLP